MDRVTYCDLVSRFGDDAARTLLQTIEKLAEINSELLRMGEEDRLHNALEALKSINFSG